MKINITVDNETEKEAAEEFLSWLCGQGEQDYWQWMDCQDNKPVVKSFQYDFANLEVRCVRIKKKE